MSVLSAVNVTKIYPGTVALDDVSVSFESGTVNAFVGKNTTTYSQEGYTYGIKNCYQYIDGGANSGGISQMDSVASMMTEAFKKTLNTNAGKDIYNTTNSGLPEFLWQSKLI